MLLVNEAQLQAFKTLLSHYEKEVLNREKSGGGGLGPAAVKSPDERKKIVAFMAWTAWTASAQRPGKPHSYTNNWPPEKLVGNELTQEAVVWSSLSIITLLGGIGLVLGLYGKYTRCSAGTERSRSGCSSCRRVTWRSRPRRGRWRGISSS
jgi:nitric oxide reductase subunit B